MTVPVRDAKVINIAPARSPDVAVAQLVESLIVNQMVAGAIPVGHPI